MLSSLEPGGSLQIHSPGNGLAFDLSVAQPEIQFGTAKAAKHVQVIELFVLFFLVIMVTQNLFCFVIQ